MKYFPYEIYTITSKLSKDEIILRLKSNIESKPLPRIPLLNSGTSKLYEGKVLRNEFIVSRILGYRNSFKPIIKGQITQNIENTTIQIRTRMMYFIYLFMLVWLGGVTFAGIIMLKEQIDSNEFDSAIFWILIMFLGGYGLMIGAFKYETNKFRKFIIEIVKY